MTPIHFNYSGSSISFLPYFLIVLFETCLLALSLRATIAVNDVLHQISQIYVIPEKT